MSVTVPNMKKHLRDTLNPYSIIPRVLDIGCDFGPFIYGPVFLF